MKIKISPSNGDGFFSHLTLHFPLALLPMAIRLAKRFGGDEELEGLDISKVKDALSDIKAYVKRNGHFTMVHIVSGDGDEVSIEV